MLRRLPWLRALSRVPRGLAAGDGRGAAMHPGCYCAGRARPRALLLPLEPCGHGLLHAAGPDAGRARGKRKSWNFIHEKMSYDTFFTLKRLIERSRSVGEVLRWVTQNPGKVSASHYPIALHKLGQLLQQGDGRGPARVLEQPEFQVLCQAIIGGCSKFDNFSIVNCLYAAAALGLPGESPLVRVLEEESRSRLGRFNQKDVSMVFSSVMRLHPSSPHPLVESCLSSLERHLEKERHPQTLFLLLSYYRLRAQALQGHPPSDQQLINNRKILRLVRHTLGQVSAVREHELALLDEMLALSAQEANNKALEAIFSSQLFYENRQERFIRSMAEWLPRKAENLTPYTMALIAKYVARHRLREPRLLDTIANFLLKRGEQLDSKVIQKLVFPFSRMNYRPSNHGELFPKLEAILEQKAGSSPLATVNILMSMFQLSHFPQSVLHQVFSPAFITNVMSSPYALIVRRYLSLLDAAVELEFRDYSGPRLDPRYRVLMFEHALTADEANRKYSYKGLVAEALRQLVGEECYRQDEVLPPGYCTDFLLWINRSGTVLPLSRIPVASKAPSSHPTTSPAAVSLRSSVLALTSDLQDFAPFAPETPSSPAVSRENSLAGRFLPTLCPAPGGPCFQPPADYYCIPSKEASLESQGSSTLSSPSECLSAQPAGTPDGSSAATLFQFPIGKILEEQEAPASCPDHDRFQGEQPPEEPQGRSPTPGEDSGPPPSPCRPSPKRGPADPHGVEGIQRVVLSVNDKWHYCQNSDILVGSRAMRDRHLRLLGYCLVQVVPGLGAVSAAPRGCDYPIIPVTAADAPRSWLLGCARWDGIQLDTAPLLALSEPASSLRALAFRPPAGSEPSGNASGPVPGPRCSSGASVQSLLPGEPLLPGAASARAGIRILPCFRPLAGPAGCSRSSGSSRCCGITPFRCFAHGHPSSRPFLSWIFLSLVILALCSQMALLLREFPGRPSFLEFRCRPGALATRGLLSRPSSKEVWAPCPCISSGFPGLPQDLLVLPWNLLGSSNPTVKPAWQLPIRVPTRRSRRNGDSTTAQGSLGQVLRTFSRKEFSPLSEYLIPGREGLGCSCVCARLSGLSGARIAVPFHPASSRGIGPAELPALPDTPKSPLLPPCGCGSGSPGPSQGVCSCLGLPGQGRECSCIQLSFPSGISAPLGQGQLRGCLFSGILEPPFLGRLDKIHHSQFHPAALPCPFPVPSLVPLLPLAPGSGWDPCLLSHPAWGLDLGFEVGSSSRVPLARVRWDWGRWIPIPGAAVTPSPVPFQLPYTELEKVSGIEEAKLYLRRKLRELRL